MYYLPFHPKMQHLS